MPSGHAERPDSPPGSRCLKRHASLVELSRDHHTALVHALELRRCRDADAAVVRRRARSFLDFARDELWGHFGDEEQVLLPAAEAVAPEQVAQVRREHREIETRAGRLAESVAAGAELSEQCGGLGDRLHDHVRFEERALFEALQTALPAAALAALGSALAARRLARGRGPGCAIR